MKSYRNDYWRIGREEKSMDPTNKPTIREALEALQKLMPDAKELVIKEELWANIPDNKGIRVYAMTMPALFKYGWSPEYASSEEAVTDITNRLKKGIYYIPGQSEEGGQ